MIKRIATAVVFVDRDGTLIEEGDYLRDPAKIRFLPGVFASLRKLRANGFTVVVVSNQSGVGRGLMTVGEQKAVARRFEAMLKAKHASVDAALYCLHGPDDKCSCRKPNAGLLRQASKKLGVPWKRGISIGDRPSDVALAQRVGGIGILVKTGYGADWAKKPETQADVVVENFNSAVRWILTNVERIDDGKRKARNRRVGVKARSHKYRAVGRRR